MDDEKISPGSERLLRGVQTTLQKIATLVVDEQSLMELASIDGILNELRHRNKGDFYLEYYQVIRLLLVEGVSLIGALPNIDAVAISAIKLELSTSLPAAMNASSRFDAIGRPINRVMRHLTTLVDAVRGNQSPAIKTFLQQVTARENEFYVTRARFSQSQSRYQADAEHSVTADNLQTYLQHRWPDRPGLKLTRFKRLVGGFQKITALFETEDSNGRKEELVLRQGKPDRFLSLDAGDISDEYEVVKFLHDRDIPVAEPLLLEADESRFGNKFFISRKVPGDNLGTSIGSTGITDGIARSFIDTIAQVHRIPVSPEMRRLVVGRWLDFSSSQDNSRANVEYWHSQPWVKTANPSPITSRLANWLTENVPQDDIPPCLIHCDYGPHNVLVHDGAVSAILDWESVRIGDPAEDISWFLQCCGGKVSDEQAIEWYEAATGARISEYRLRYYAVFGCLKTMVASGSAGALYEAREEASVAWCDLNLLYTSFTTSAVEERIRLAESARGR